MTVKELIEKLQILHQDAEVYLDSEGLEPIDDVWETLDDSEEGRYAERRGNPWWEVWLVTEKRRS